MATTGCYFTSNSGSRSPRILIGWLILHFARTRNAVVLFTTWDTWMAFDDVTRALCALSAAPSTIDNWMEPLEQVVVLLYDHASSQESVNQARKHLFTKKGRTCDGSPPPPPPPQHKQDWFSTQRRLPTKLVTAGGQILVEGPELPSLGDSGWKRKDTGGWEIHWTSLPEAIQACRRLLCGCKTGSRGQCKCVKAAL